MKDDQGLSLRDLAKRYEKVRVGEGEGDFVRVYGLSAEMCLALLNRHPDILVKALQGRGVGFNDIIRAAPGVLSAILAAGTGNMGDEEVEEDAKHLPIEVQTDMLEAIGRLSFRSGFGPFVERIMKLARGAGTSASSGKVPDMKSPQESKS